MARRSGALHYPVFALLFVVQALMWHYPPHNRFVLPILPVLLAGFWTELKHLAGIVRQSFRKPKREDRIAAAVVTAGLAVFALFAASRIHYGLTDFLPGVLGHHRRALAANLEAYRWISKNAPPEARIFAYGDPLVYLYTGRKACSLRLPPKLLYKGDNRGIEEFVYSLPNFVREFHLDYVLFTLGDFQLDSPEVGFAALKRVLNENATFQLRYQGPQAAVYRVVSN
jgi:hypothetical protein